jgi:hypothetical protein
MQEYNEAEIARSGRKTRSSKGPLMEMGRDFADDDMHEYANPAEDEKDLSDADDLLAEEDKEEVRSHNG